MDITFNGPIEKNNNIYFKFSGQDKSHLIGHLRINIFTIIINVFCDMTFINYLYHTGFVNLFDNNTQ